MLRILIALLMFAPNLHAMEVPTLRLKSYADLAFPPQLSKDVLQKHIDDSAQALHGLAFENMGDMSDWMHGHVLFRPQDGAESPPYPLTDPSWSPDWSKLDLKGILYHTQEYDHLRAGRPYVGPNGELDKYDRNWLLIIGETASRLVRAIDWMEKEPPQRPFTIRSDDLRQSVFGSHPGNWEYSVYFFRVKCDQFSPQELAGTNVFEVLLKNERLCLAFENFLCRNYSKTDPRCQQGPPLQYESAL